MDFVLLNLLQIIAASKPDAQVLIQKEQVKERVGVEKVLPLKQQHTSVSDNKKIGSWFFSDHLDPSKLEGKFQKVQTVAKARSIRSPSYISYNVENSISLTPPKIELSYKFDSAGIAAVDFNQLMNNYRFPDGNNVIQKLSQFSHGLQFPIPENDKNGKTVIASADNDEMTFINYAQQEEDQISEIDKISSMVMSSIKREIGDTKKFNVSAGQTVAPQPPVDPTDRVVNQASTSSANALVAAEDKSTQLSIELISDAKEELDAGNPIYYLSSSKNSLFELENERGIFNHGCLSDCGVARIEISGEGFPTTNFDLNVDSNLAKLFVVKTLSSEMMAKLMQKYNVNEDQGFLLFQRGEKETDVEIDRSYTKKIYFDAQMQEVGYSAAWKYLAILGIDPGNATITYQIGETGHIRIANLEAGKIYYDYPMAIKDEKEIYQFYKDDSLSTEEYPYSVSAYELKPFDRNESLTQQSHFEIEANIILRDKRYPSYKQLSKGNRPLYLGHRGNKIYIPTENFIDNVIKDLNISDSSESCITQLNFSSSPQDLEIDIVSADGSNDAAVYFLDKDGAFSEMPSPITKKMFIFGLGSSFVTINYKDELDRKMFHQSFCTQGIYLVEQF